MSVAGQGILPSPSSVGEHTQWASWPAWFDSAFFLAEFQELLDKQVDLFPSNVRHDDDVGNVVLAGKAPPLHELMGFGSLKDNGAAEVVQPAGDAVLG